MKRPLFLLVIFSIFGQLMAQIPAYSRFPSWAGPACQRVLSTTQNLRSPQEAAGSVQEVWSPEGRILRRVSLQAQGTCLETWEYDAQGLLLAEVRDGQRKAWTWTQAGSGEWLQQAGEGEEWRWTHREQGWLAVHTEQGTETERMEWTDAWIPVSQYTRFAELQTWRTYDEHGTCIRETVQDHGTWESEDAPTRTRRYRPVYDESGRLTELYSGDNLIQRNLYDDSGRCISVIILAGAHNPLSRTDYTCQP